MQIVLPATAAGALKLCALKPKSESVHASVADVKFLGSQDVLISASSDNTSRIWRASGDDGAMTAAAVLKTHGAEVRTSYSFMLYTFPKLHTLCVQQQQCLPRCPMEAA